MEYKYLTWEDNVNDIITVDDEWINIITGQYERMGTGVWQYHVGKSWYDISKLRFNFNLWKPRRIIKKKPRLG